MLAQFAHFFVFLLELSLFLALWLLSFHSIWILLNACFAKLLRSFSSKLTTAVAGLVCISILFEIIHAYQIEESRRLAAILQGYARYCSASSGHAENDGSGGRLGFVEAGWYWLSGMWRLKDECESYHEYVGTSVFWRLSPVRILFLMLRHAVTFTLETIGRSIGGGFKELFASFPVVYHGPLLFAVITIFVICSFVWKGYAISILAFIKLYPTDNCVTANVVPRNSITNGASSACHSRTPRATSTKNVDWSRSLRNVYETTPRKRI